MLEKTERLWDYEAIEPGQAGRPTTVLLTDENIAQYARLSQNPDPRFRTGAKPTAMPTMILSYAPLLRDDMAENNGFVALEQSQHHRRQTPFAKCEIRWSRPVHAGDTITGNRRVLEKYQRRGSKFVTFRVEAANQRGEKVAEYDYTCIFEYAGGQRPAPSEPGPSIDPGSSDPGLREPGPGEDAGSPANSGPLSFAAISVGDRLAPLAITESQDIINAKNDFRLAGKPSASNIHTDEEFARQNIFGGTVNAGPATMSYVDQVLEQSFPLSAFYCGGSLLMRAITPFRSGDTVTFGGEVTNKEEDGDKKLVQCRVKGINQRGELVCLADATLNLAG